MKTKLVLTLLLLAGTFAAFKIEDSPFAALLKKMEAYNQKYPQEKVYLHLDKPYYAIGDDIWFKAYVINTQTTRPTNISDILYVELISESDSVKKQLKLPLMAGISWGDFKLPDSLQEGNYRIRAYTQWMRNAGPEFFFDKTLKIGNAWANKVFTNATYTISPEDKAQKINSTIRFTDKAGHPYTATEISYVVQMNLKNVHKGKAVTNNNGEIDFSFLNTHPELKTGTITATLALPDKQKVSKNILLNLASQELDVQFFPEGGNLVENIPSKVAFKAINSAGLGKDISGTLVDNEGTEVTKFNSSYLGMGNFTLNPQSGKTYTAVLKMPNGSEQKVNLPKAQSSGYVLSVNLVDSTKFSVRLYISQDNLNKGELKLVGQNNGTLCFSTVAKTEKQVVSVNIPTKDIPSGIIQFTLFGPNNEPVAERLAFVHNTNDFMDLQLQSDKKTYQKREQVKFNLSSGFEGKPVQGSFSVSVTNTTIVQPDLDNESNIYTSLLLTSDLSGYVEKPNHYFQDRSATTLHELDNLLMTQGWRRFLWKNVINDLPPLNSFQPEKSLKISGTITTLGGKPIEKGKVSLFSSSGGLFTIDTLSDANGRFSFDNLIFNDSTKFVVQARTGKNKKNVEIKMDVVPGQMVTKNKNTGDIEVNVNEAISGYVKKSENYFEELTRRGLLQRSINLKEVNIVEKKNPAKNSSNLNGAGRADAVITAEQLGTCVTLSQCLQGRVAGLMIRNGQAYLMRSQGTPMNIVVDGMPMEPDFLDNLNPQDVETIEVLKSIGNTAIYGMRGGGGVLVITTKRGGGNYSTVYAPGIITYNPKGYYSSRQFYSPKFTPQSSSRPDLRTTVYWNPQVVTDAAGKKEFDYYNTDLPGLYRVVLEGINGAGQLGRKVYTYEVK